MLWECENEHTWNATQNNVMRGSWCPKCSIGISEDKCRATLEFLFKKKFPTIRPDFLKFEKDSNLELDCYNAELKLAVEFNGVQHYEQMYYDEDEKRLVYQQEKDAFKAIKCEELGIKLISVHYADMRNKSTETFIKIFHQLLLDNGVQIPLENQKKLCYEAIRPLMKNRINKKRESVLKILEEKCGTLVSDFVPIGYRDKFMVRCLFGHEFVTYAEQLKTKKNNWCPRDRSNEVKVNFENQFNKEDNQYIIDRITRFGHCSFLCRKCGVEGKTKFFELRKHICPDTSDAVAGRQPAQLEVSAPRPVLVVSGMQGIAKVDINKFDIIEQKIINPDEMSNKQDKYDCTK
jgi:hypothetical protein